jgi:diacylglycerol kinase (ATP)
VKPIRWIDKANVAIEGVIYSVKTQRHMRYHLVAAMGVLLLSLMVNITRTEFILLSLAIILVLITEMLNTAIEVAVDMISAEYHPKAKIAKDIAAGVVLVASIGALILAYLILYPAIREAIAARSWRVRKAPDDVVAFVSFAVVVIVVVIIKAVLGKGEPLRGGMPSGHAAVSFSVWVATIYLSGSPYLIALTFVLAAIVSWSRWSSGVHKPGEVFAGAFLGAGLTLLLFLLFSQK